MCDQFVEIVFYVLSILNLVLLFIPATTNKWISKQASVSAVSLFVVLCYYVTLDRVSYIPNESVAMGASLGVAVLLLILMACAPLASVAVGTGLVVYLIPKLSDPGRPAYLDAVAFVAGVAAAAVAIVLAGGVQWLLYQTIQAVCGGLVASFGVYGIATEKLCGTLEDIQDTWQPWTVFACVVLARFAIVFVYWWKCNRRPGYQSLSAGASSSVPGVN